MTIYRRSEIDVIGPIWMPSGLAATTYTLTDSDITNMRDDKGEITRDSVALWLDSHAGDFQHITDFHASLDTVDPAVQIDWQDDESEVIWADLMYPTEPDI